VLRQGESYHLIGIGRKASGQPPVLELDASSFFRHDREGSAQCVCGPEVGVCHYLVIRDFRLTEALQVKLKVEFFGAMPVDGEKRQRSTCFVVDPSNVEIRNVVGDRRIITVTAVAVLSSRGRLFEVPQIELQEIIASYQWLDHS
jgi:hypothetical protein